MAFAYLVLCSSDLASSQEAATPQGFQVEGVVKEKGTSIPLKGINVYVLPHKLKAITNDKGEFFLESVPFGDFEWVINVPGYKKWEEKQSIAPKDFGKTTADANVKTSANANAVADVDADAGAAPSAAAPPAADGTAPNILKIKKNFFVERTSYEKFTFETTVLGRRKKDVAQKSLSRQTFLTLPGSSGDPVKAVQNLPGVNRVIGGSSQVVIQGSSAKDTRYDIDGHEVPQVFHFGGLTSVVQPESIANVDYLSAGYTSFYGRALGGIVSLKTRSAEVDTQVGRKGFVFMDTLKAGGLFESQIDESSSIWLGGRYSYIGLLLRELLKDNESFNLTVAPEFADLSVGYDKKIDEKNQLKVVSIYSQDTLEFLFREPLRQDPSIRGSFSNRTSFWRLIPQWEYDSKLDWQWRTSVGIGEDRFFTEIGDKYFKNTAQTLTLRSEFEKKLSPQWVGTWGMDNRFTTADLSLRLPIPNNEGGINNPISSGNIREVDIKAQGGVAALYWENTLTPEESAWTLKPNFRVDHFSTTKENFFSPRFAASHKWSSSLTLNGATGMYYQPPTPQESDRAFGNPDIKSPRALHLALGMEKDFREGQEKGWQLVSGFFWREFSQLVADSQQQRTDENGQQVPEIFNNSGSGHAYGWEAQLKWEVGQHTGWLSYTLSKSTRKDDRHDEYLFEYDQTHNINLVESYEFSRNWKLGGRVRYVTGNPYTPVVGGYFDADNDLYFPVRGQIYSERLNDFFQVDLRVDKKWIYNTSIVSGYLDIQNLLNSKNPEAIQYSYDYSQKESITGLPLFFALGVKIEFN